MNQMTDALRMCVLLSLWNYCMAVGYMSTLATMWGAACALQAQSLLPICSAPTNGVVANNTNAPNNTQFWAISGGGYFSCGLSYKDRTPICWGQNPGSNITPSLKNISYSNLNSGGWHACAVRADGSGAVDCWGNNAYGQATPPAGSFTSVTAGDYFTCGLRSSGFSVCWGTMTTSSSDTIADPGSQYSAIFAGREHVCGIQKDTQKTLCWGNNYNNHSQPPSQYNFSAITAGLRHTCGIREDNHEAVCWGDNGRSQTSVGAGIKFSVISAGDYFTCGVRLDKPMLTYCWGDNYASHLLFIGNVSETSCQSKCDENQYKMDSTVLGLHPCPNSSDKICVDCSRCSNGMLEASACGTNKDRTCAAQAQISSAPQGQKQPNKNISKSFPVVAVAVAISVSIVIVISLVYLYWRMRLAGKVDGPWEDTPQRIEEFSNLELSTATRGYSATMLLGKGGFGMVYKGALPDGRLVAVKKSINIERSKSFDQELRLLARLHHAYLVNLIGFCKQEKVLVFEFMENGSLFDFLFIKKTTELDWRMRIKIAAQAARGLEYLHTYASPRIIHRDVKAGNILLDKEWNAHVADFGLSLFGPAKDATHVSNLTVVGTPGYLDPEYFHTLQLTVKSDVYGFGIVILELITGRKAFNQEEGSVPAVGAWVSDLVKDNKLLHALDPSLEHPRDLSPIIEALHLGLCCIRPTGKERPTMAYVATTLEACLEQLMGNDPSSSTSYSTSLSPTLSSRVTNCGV